MEGRVFGENHGAPIAQIPIQAQEMTRDGVNEKRKENPTKTVRQTVHWWQNSAGRILVVRGCKESKRQLKFILPQYRDQRQSVSLSKLTKHRGEVIERRNTIQASEKRKRSSIVRNERKDDVWRTSFLVFFCCAGKLTTWTNYVPLHATPLLQQTLGLWRTWVYCLSPFINALFMVLS